METAHILRSENLDWEKADRRFHVDASTLCLLPGLPMPRVLEVLAPDGGVLIMLSDFFEVIDEAR